MYTSCMNTLLTLLVTIHSIKWFLAFTNTPKFTLIAPLTLLSLLIPLKPHSLPNLLTLLSTLTLPALLTLHGVPHKHCLHCLHWIHCVHCVYQRHCFHSYTAHTARTAQTTYTAHDAYTAYMLTLFVLPNPSTQFKDKRASFLLRQLLSVSLFSIRSITWLYCVLPSKFCNVLMASLLRNSCNTFNVCATYTDLKSDSTLSRPALFFIFVAGSTIITILVRFSPFLYNVSKMDHAADIFWSLYTFQPPWLGQSFQYNHCTLFRHVFSTIISYTLFKSLAAFTNFTQISFKSQPPKNSKNCWHNIFIINST